MQGFICDKCGKQAKGNEAFPGLLPTGWYRLQRYDEPRAKYPTWDCCSVDCLNIVVQQRIVDEHDLMGEVARG